MAGLIVSDGAGQLGLDVLDPGESRRLLERIVGEERVAAEPVAAERLARLCGGLPLAIRIAAANLLVRRVGLGDYCAELTADGRGEGLLSRLRVDGDQRSTIRLAFELSYRALPDPAQRVFRLLSLMPGADVAVHASAALADLTAAEAEVELKVLAEAHLLEERGNGRYDMHDLLRTYARELTAADAREARLAQERLFDWYLCHTEAAAQLLCPPDTAPGSRPVAGLPPSTLFPTHAQAGEWLEGERENLVGAVLQAARSGFPRAAWQIAEHLHGFLYQGAYTADCLEVAAAALSAAEADGELRAQAAARLRYGESRWALGENALALRQYARAQQLAGQAGWQAGRALALRRIGAAHQENGAMSLAFQFLSQARELAGRTDRAGAAEDLTNLGLICWKLGRLAEAAAHFTTAAQMYQELEDRRAVAIAHTNLGIAYRAMGRPRETIRVIGQALPVHVGNGNKVSEVVALNCLAGAHTDLGDPVAGGRLARAALEAARSLGQRRLEANALIALGAAQERAGDLAGSADSYRAAVELAELVGDCFPQVAALVGEGMVQARLEKYDDAQATARRAAAIAGSAELRVLEGCALDVLADVSLRRGEPGAAVDAACASLALHRSTGHRPGELRSRLVLADAYAVLGEPEKSAEHRREAELLRPAVRRRVSKS
jgi:tetratricopeptide (TPR) repeat protein